MNKNMDLIISVLQPLVNKGIISHMELDRIKNIPDGDMIRKPKLDTLKTIKETCVLLRCDRKTIYNWMGDGILEFTRLSPKKVLIFESSIIRFVEKRKNLKFKAE